MSNLVPFWFIVIAFFWTGFFILEGFDFGVGMLHSLVGRDDAGRRAAINTIGPLWDGNEVWLIVAGAGMFAAFPGWYATMFSAFNLALVLLLVALIARGLAFEYRGKRDAVRWRRTWDVCLTAGSVLAPFVIGIALGDLLHGLPINSSQNYTGSFWDLFQPYGVYTGITLVLICALHGATFLVLKTTGDMRDRARQLARRIAPFTCAAVIGFAIWTHVSSGRGTFFLNPIELLAILAAIAALWLVYGDSPGFAFAATTVTIASCIVAIFVDLYPNVMVSTTSSAYNLTAHNTASGGYTLKVMTVVAIILLPVVLAYQSWTYYVFRRRISKSEFEPVPQPGTSPGPQPVITPDAAHPSPDGES
jgi:cytochrome bd ubiquinol oxidase subunit II